MTLEEENLRLVATLRQMDQKIYRISQCQSYTEMRPILGELVSETMGRMQQESDRIRMLMVPEIRRVYAQPQEETAASHGHPRLAGPGDAGGQNHPRRDDRDRPRTGAEGLPTPNAQPDDS